MPCSDSSQKAGQTSKIIVKWRDSITTILMHVNASPSMAEHLTLIKDIPWLDFLHPPVDEPVSWPDLVHVDLLVPFTLQD